MADEVDIAQQFEERALHEALSKRVIYAGTSAEECTECGEPIPTKRQELLPGVQTCVDCANT